MKKNKRKPPKINKSNSNNKADILYNQKRPLKVELYTQDDNTITSYNNVDFNCCDDQKATEFETDLFKGVTKVFVRTNPIEDHLMEFFDGRKRNFEMQVQGKFKRLPKGEIYVGGEMSEIVQFGLIGRSIANAAISLTKSLVSGLHYSFGTLNNTNNNNNTTDDEDNRIKEKPHLVAPLFLAFDKIIITKENETPPELGQPFTEDLEYRKKRFKFKSVFEAEINCAYTYSFSVNSSNVNFLHWTMVNIPLIRPMPLKNFISNFPIYLVGYEVPTESEKNNNNKHIYKDLNYLFKMKLSHNSDIIGVPQSGESMTFSDSAFDVSDDLPGIESDDVLRNATDYSSYSDDDDGIRDTRMSSANDIDERVTGETKGIASDNMTSVKLKLMLDDAYGDTEGMEEAVSVHSCSDGEYIDECNKDAHSRGSTTGTDNRKQKSHGVKSSMRGVRQSMGWLKKHIASAAGTATAVTVGKGSTLITKQLVTDVDYGPYGGIQRQLGANDDYVDSAGKLEYYPTDYALECGGDLRYCPASLDLIDRRRGTHRRRIFYMLPSLTGLAFLHSKDQSEKSLQANPLTPRLRSFSEILKVLPLNATVLPRMYKNSKFSQMERRRRRIIAACKALERCGGSNGNYSLASYESFLQNICDTDKCFLGGNISVHRKHSDSADSNEDYNAADNRSTVSFEGFVAMATSRRHWVEYKLVLDSSGAAFYTSSKDVDSVTKADNDNSTNNKTSDHKHSRKSQERRKASRKHAAIRIPLSSIISVQPLSSDTVPIVGTSFFQIETFPRVYYMMVRSDIQVQEWIEAFVTYLGSAILHSPFDVITNITSNSDNSSAIDVDSCESSDKVVAIISDVVARKEFSRVPSVGALGVIDGAHSAIDNSAAYLATSDCWRLDKKRIFNYRRIIFNSNSIDGSDINSIVERILSLVLKLAQSDDAESEDVMRVNAIRWVKFMDELSLLQVCDISKLSEVERAALLLNLYHVMVLHGGLMVGFHWPGFYHNITYLFSYDIISPIDLEYNIIKAGMSHTSTLSANPIPKHCYPGLALTERDFRFNFVINNASQSMPNSITIFTPQNLDDQLDEMTALHLSTAMKIDYIKKTISLTPKISLGDFTAKPIDSNNSDTTRDNVTTNVNQSTTDTTTNNINQFQCPTANSQDCIRILAMYLPTEHRNILLRMLAEGVHFQIKYKHTSNKYRKFELYQT